MSSDLVSPARFRRLMRETLLLPVAALAVVAALLVAQILVLVHESQAEARSDVVIADANRALRLAVDAETGERGYLISGSRLFLDPYRQSTQALPAAFRLLARDTAQNPVQARRVREMQASYMRWLKEAQVEMQMLGQGQDVRSYFNQHKSKDLMDDLRQEADQFVAAEDVQHRQRGRAAQWALRSTIGLTVVGVVGVGLILAAYSRRLMHALALDYDEALTAEVQAREMFSATLLGIGDAVLVTDASGRVTLLNAVAERLTGWTSDEARGRDSRDVFSIFHEATYAEVVSPIQRVIQSGAVVGLANHTVLRRRDGTETPIDDSGAPIRDAGGRLVGVVLVFRDVSERRAAERELQQALRREHRIAATLQRSLLQAPPPDAFPGVALGSVYEPARLAGDGETLEVGGDFLDAFALSEGRVAVVVGDVSGKGLIAAARTAEVLYTLRGLLRESGAPGEALTRLNRALCSAPEREFEDGFICVSVAVLDPARQTATVSVAGAEPPLITRADGPPEEIFLHAVPLAVLSETPYQAVDVRLGDGDTLVMVTDGITEARRGGELFGYPRLLEFAARAAPDDSPPDLAQAILQEAKAFTGGPLRDDACVLAARFA